MLFRSLDGAGALGLWVKTHWAADEISPDGKKDNVLLSLGETKKTTFKNFNCPESSIINILAFRCFDDFEIEPSGIQRKVIFPNNTTRTKPDFSQYTYCYFARNRLVCARFSRLLSLFIFSSLLFCFMSVVILRGTDLFVFDSTDFCRYLSCVNTLILFNACRYFASSRVVCRRFSWIVLLFLAKEMKMYCFYSVCYSTVVPSSKPQ